MMKKYVESGVLRMEWRDFPYQGQESVNAALAARAAQEQGKFWEYHDLLYENQAPANSGGYSDENLTKLAREAGLDVDKFQKSFQSGKFQEAVQSDFEEGQQLGISGTPAFVINDTKLIGLQPMQTFEQVIEEERQKAGGGS